MTNRSRVRRSVTFIAAALVLSGCGPVGFNVGMERLISNVIFGVPQPAKPAPAPEAAPLPPPELPSLDNFQIPGNPTQPSACPEATPGTPADRAATTDISDVADDGVYKWYSSYSRTPNGSTSGATVTSDFEAREVKLAQQLADDPSSAVGTPDHVYTWTEVKPDPFQDGYIDVLKFVAHTYSNLDNPPATFIVSVQSGGNYDPNGGIDLVDLQRFAPGKSTPVEEFNPAGPAGTNPGLLIFALPVPGANNPIVTPPTSPPVPLPGQSSNNLFSWTETAADPAHQWTETIQGVQGNQRVALNACGSVIDAWPAEATLTITKTNPATGQPYTSPLTLTWIYYVAPQYGGLIVNEQISGDGGYGSSVKTDETIASLQVAPLPKGS
jgi:hypothetical protein